MQENEKSETSCLLSGEDVKVDLVATPGLKSDMTATQIDQQVDST